MIRSMYSPGRMRRIFAISSLLMSVPATAVTDVNCADYLSYVRRHNRLMMARGETPIVYNDQPMRLENWGSREMLTYQRNDVRHVMRFTEGGHTYTACVDGGCGTVTSAETRAEFDQELRDAADTSPEIRVLVIAKGLLAP